MTTQEIKDAILSGNGELSFALRGKFENIRVWGGHDGNGREPIDTIFMRYDHANQTSAPWSEYPIPEHPKLATFGFKTSITQLNELAAVLSEMKPRECIAW